MPSMRHEMLVELFWNRPSLAAELLEEAFGVKVPAYTEARVVATELTQIQPAEYVGPGKTARQISVDNVS